MSVKEVWHNYVFVDKVHAPVRDARKPISISFAKEGQIIWCKETNQSTPIAISLANTTTFTVQLGFSSACYGLNIKVTGSVPSSSGGTFTSQTITIGQDAGTIIEDGVYIQNIPVTLQGLSSVVPWGFRGEVTWTLSGDTADIQLQDGSPLKSTLSVYALVDDLAPYFSDEGIPLQFLELMVLPTSDANPSLTTRDLWVTWIVWRCFTSKFDPYIRENYPEKADQAIHSYRYNAFLSGSSNFFFNSGGTFDLDQWLVNCTPPVEGQWYGVNCYDQSALLQVTLSLGMPYHYVDKDNNKVPDPKNKEKFLHTVGKLFRDPFGYINTLDLIGWGLSDSPFFIETAQKMSTALQKPTDRTSFRNHAWVYIRNSSTNPDDVSALDACAGKEGPTATPVSITDYLTTAVDSQATLDDTNTKYFENFDEDLLPDLYNGVTKIVIDQPLSRWEQHTFMGDSMPRLRCDGKELFVGNAGPGLSLTSLLKTVHEDVTPFPVPIDLLATNALAKACGLLNAAVPAASTDVHVGDTETFTYGPFKVRTSDPAVSSDGTLLRYDLWMSDTGAPYLSISFVILTDFAQAMTWLVTFLGGIDHISDTVWDISSSEVQKGKVLVSPQPGVTLGATIQSNVLVILEGTADPSVMSGILSSVNDCMTQFFDDDLTEVDIDKCVLSDVPTTLSGNQVFNMTLTAPGAIDVSVAFNTKAIHPQTSRSDQTDTWTVNCTTYSDKDYIAKGRKLTACFAAKSTWYTTSKEFSIGP